jgi:hypothetical protein
MPQLKDEKKTCTRMYKKRAVKNASSGEKKTVSPDDWIFLLLKRTSPVRGSNKKHVKLTTIKASESV